MSNDRISWKNHLIELLVVFIGISTAFMLNNWREDQKDRARERQYLQSFYEEVESDGARLDTIILRNEEKLAIITHTIALLRAGDVEDDSLLAAVSQMVQIHLFIPKTNVYETAKFSGSFSLIENAALRTQLIGYYEKYEGKELVEEYFRMYIDQYMLPFLFDHIDMVEGTLVNKGTIHPWKVKNLIAGYHQLMTQLIDFYRELAADNEALRASLQPVLDGSAS